VEGSLAPDLVRSSLVAVVVDGQWRLGIGDPGLMGWCITAAYGIVCALCAWAAFGTLHARGSGSARELPLFWAVVALLVLALGINKQLDLQMWLFITGKHLATAQRWYEYRRTVEAFFAMAGAAVSVSFLFLLGWYAKGAMRRHALALTGMALIVCFILLRAGSLLRIGMVLHWQVGLARMNWAVELAGLACVGVSALLAISRAGKKHPPSETIPQHSS